MTGPMLRIIRECAGLSQVALGKMLGTSQMWISRYERGVALIPEEIAEKVALDLPKPTLEAQKVKETDAYLKEHRRGRPRKESVENDLSKSTDRGVTSAGSTDPVEVRMCPVVELGPETMKALKDMIETAVREMVKVKTEAPVAIRPEVIKAAKEGDIRRSQTQAILGRGW